MKPSRGTGPAACPTRHCGHSPALQRRGVPRELAQQATKRDDGQERGETQVPGCDYDAGGGTRAALPEKTASAPSVQHRGHSGPAGWPVRCVMSEMTTTSTHTYTPVELCRAGNVHFCRMRNILPSREKVKLTRDESDSVEIPLGVSGAPFAPSPHVAPWALSSRFAFCLPQLLPACHAPPRAQRCARGGKCVARGGRSQPRRLTGHRLAGFHLERQNETAFRSSCDKKST